MEYSATTQTFLMVKFLMMRHRIQMNLKIKTTLQRRVSTTKSAYAMATRQCRGLTNKSACAMATRQSHRAEHVRLHGQTDLQAGSSTYLKRIHFYSKNIYIPSFYLATDNSENDCDGADDGDNNDNGGNSSVDSRSDDEAMDVDVLGDEEATEAGSSAADSGRGESVNAEGEDVQAAAHLEHPPPRNNEHQNAGAPASPDPAVNRGFAVDRLPVQADVNAWLRRVVQQQQAPIVMPEQVMEWRVGRNHLDRMVLLRQPNPRFLEGEHALGQPEDLLQRERELLVYMFDGFRPNFTLVEACDHALLWAFVLPTGAWRGICCFEHVRDYPGLREVIIHKTGLKGAVREQCAVCPGCHLPTWRVVGARHCDMCTPVIILNQDAILSRSILESSPPDGWSCDELGFCASHNSAFTGSDAWRHRKLLLRGSLLPTSKCACTTDGLVGRKVGVRRKHASECGRVRAGRVRPMSLYAERSWDFPTNACWTSCLSSGEPTDRRATTRVRVAEARVEARGPRWRRRVQAYQSPHRWRRAAWVRRLRRDVNKPGNYRGISLLPTAYKVYTEIIRGRLVKEIEEKKILPEGQAGFRKGRSTMDNLYTLNYVIQKAKKDKEKVYATFIDLKKAFDTVNRKKLWECMQRLGISEYLTERIKQLYEETKGKVRWKNEVSEEFWTVKGVRQGCLLSPILFCIYIAEMEKEFERRNVGGVRIGNTRIWSLAYADDIVILSKNREAMKDMLQSTQRFFKERQLELSEEKTKILIFNKRRNQKEEKWQWKEDKRMASMMEEPRDGMSAGQEEEKTWEDVEKWICYMDSEELGEALCQLELKADGSVLQRKARLFQWISGDYSADDFIQTNLGETDTKEHHVSLRAAFINATCWEKSGDTMIDCNVNNDQPHPLIGLSSSERVRQNLERSMGQVAAKQDQRPEDRARLEKRNSQSGSKTMSSDPKSTQEQQCAETSIIVMSSQIEELKRQMDNLRLQQTTTGVVSSTRLDPRAPSFHVGTSPSNPAYSNQVTDHRRVNFQDTINYGPVAAGDWREPENGQGLQSRDLESLTNTGLLKATSSRYTQEGSFRYNNDIGETVRRWKIQFDRFGQMSVESFIERIEECRILAGLNEIDLLPALSETLTGTAAKWYRCNRHRFQTWKEFCVMARKTFGMDQFTYQQLLEQIKKRTQGREERVIEYIICMQSTLSKLRPELDTKTQLDYLHGGMLPELQKMVRRRYLRSIDDLVDDAVEAEGTILKAEQYRAPESGETIWPELRYKSGKDEPRYTISAATNQNDAMATLIQTHIEATQSLATSIKELNSKLPAIDDKLKDKSQAEMLQQMSKSIVKEVSGQLEKLQKQITGQPGKPDGQRYNNKKNEKREAPTKQQEQTQPSENKEKKAKEFHCYGCGAPNVIRKNCPNCSGNGGSRE
ncbi:unnamed protein product [Trichogramma brassicae]|uniref:Reverse transcriptase domain-containing protein n=1 Tax=Trichogramma brassicae TaxID=86971 RepID=A0A6H5IWP4_9HYME|nr:unnamed protein product [Trichogramma brassicae]